MRLALLTTTFGLGIGNQAFLLARRRWAKAVFGILFDGEGVFAVLRRRFFAFEIEAGSIWCRNGCTDLQFFTVDDTLGLNALAAALLVVRRHVFEAWIALILANDARLAIYRKAGLFISNASEVAAAVVNDGFANVDGDIALEDALGFDADAAALAFWHHQFLSEFASHAVDHCCLDFGSSLVGHYALINGAWVFLIVPFLSWLSDVGRQLGVGLLKADNWFALAAASELLALLIDLRFKVFVARLAFFLALVAEASQSIAAFVQLNGLDLHVWKLADWSFRYLTFIADTFGEVAANILREFKLFIRLACRWFGALVFVTYNIDFVAAFRLVHFHDLAWPQLIWDDRFCAVLLGDYTLTLVCLATCAWVYYNNILI